MEEGHSFFCLAPSGIAIPEEAIHGTGAQFPHPGTPRSVYFLEGQLLKMRQSFPGLVPRGLTGIQESIHERGSTASPA